MNGVEAATLSANPAAGNLAARLAAVRERIARAAVSAGRDPAAIRLLAVTKTQPPETLRAAQKLGLTEFGENYLQEAARKQDVLDGRPSWHFIGALQSNKTREVAARFDWVHTVDRLRIARRLAGQRPPERPPLQVCVQVNIDDEPGKAGVAPDQAAALCADVAELPGLQLRGLMALPRPRSDPAAQRAIFDAIRNLRDDIDPELDTLSMGMSADLEAAVAAGSTILRIGTALFGPRQQQRSQA